MAALPLSDPEVAAARLAKHLDKLWENDRVHQANWQLLRIDPLHVVVSMYAKRSSGEKDLYNILCAGIYYDAYPPDVRFVIPPQKPDNSDVADWVTAKVGDRKFPKITPPGWFGLHPTYAFKDGGGERQLVCFSFTAGYYQSDHNPDAAQKWIQGHHTIAATLWRLQEVLLPPYYQGPSEC